MGKNKRERGGDRHPDASEGKYLHRLLVAHCGFPEFREGLLGKFYTAKEMVKILEKSGKWVTNVKTLKGKVNYVQTMMGRHRSEWYSERRERGVKYYQYIGNSYSDK